MNKLDVIIAGGGPAGSTAATILAQYGHKVLLLEKQQHPRFHIGESMMPMIEPVMKRIGIDWSEGNLSKCGAEFIDEASGKQATFSLQQKFNPYQIDRAQFDAKLFSNAERKGAQTRQREAVSKVNCTPDSVSVETNQSKYKARYFVDATGRNALMGRLQKSLERYRNLGSFALYQHFHCHESKLAEALFATGKIKVLLQDIGWFWLIPLTNRRLSIGLVVRGQRPEGFTNEGLFQHYVQKSPYLTELLLRAESLDGIKAEADFSYKNKLRFGLRYVCIGDAGGFLDPVFSSGFFFAVKTAERMADRLHPALVAQQENDPKLHSIDAVDHDRGFDTMYAMIERFYHSGLVDNLFFESERHPRIKQEIGELLGGEFWNNDNLFQQSMLNSRRSG